VRHIVRVNGREQASRARVTGESMEEDDIWQITSYRDELIGKKRATSPRSL